MAKSKHPASEHHHRAAPITTLPRIITIKPPIIMTSASTRRRRNTPKRRTNTASKDTSTARPRTSILVSDRDSKEAECLCWPTNHKRGSGSVRAASYDRRLKSGPTGSFVHHQGDDDFRRFFDVLKIWLLDLRRPGWWGRSVTAEWHRRCNKSRGLCVFGNGKPNVGSGLPSPRAQGFPLAARACGVRAALLWLAWCLSSG